MALRSVALRARSLFAGATASALVATTVVTSPVAAATNDTRVFATLGNCDFIGDGAGASKVVKVQWKDADGRMKGKQSVTSDTAGNWETACEPGELLESGDKIKTTIKGVDRNFTVPKLTLSADRVENTVSGRSPSTDQISVEVDTFNGGFGTPTRHIAATPTVGGDGSWSVDFDTEDDSADIKGWDIVWVVASTDRGDLFGRTLQAPGLQLWLKQPWVIAVGRPGSTAGTDLSPATAAVAATAYSAFDFFGQSTTQFMDAEGDTVRLQAGQSIESNIADDMRFTVPNVSGSASRSTDVVSGNCEGEGSLGYEVTVYHRDFSLVKSRHGHTNGSGDFSQDFSVKSKFDLLSGDRVDIQCRQPNGDIVARTIAVP